MRLGMFMHPIHDFKRGYHTLLFEDLDVIRAADQEGFDEVWLGEHYLLPSEPFASPLMLYARLIAECPRITFGSGVLCLPNKHPALVAGEAAQFDHLAKGRFMLGIGPVPRRRISRCSVSSTRIAWRCWRRAST
jgi:alkanesulfonate monooxygenase SsuD/methylene tetrahydromethanopterin reductase-like flavin-dependent oxidoreductase (luciferase family)